ncbi:MAG: hypothetical protein WC222_00325 [Parachlamydiales bacterium]|jgi:hypothetical protein
MNKAESKSELRAKLARLESINDHLTTEIVELDALMRLVGFSYGIHTVKATATEILEKGYLENVKDDRGDY